MNYLAKVQVSDNSSDTEGSSIFTKVLFIIASVIILIAAAVIIIKFKNHK